MSETTINRRQRIKAGSEERYGSYQAEIVQSLTEHLPGFRARRWKESVLAELQADISSEDEDFRAAVQDLAFVPDGYIILPEERALHFFEVEVTSPMSKDKLEAYAAFVTDMHTYGVTFELFTVNQHGHINEVPLIEHYIEWLQRFGKGQS